ncbi:hypothetical protein JYB62_10155 [Algoriphagus lutimaris]|nr:hypothetical protein [Algoriphagus lutimaris]
MAIENRNSIEIPEAVLADALGKLNEARELLAPYLIALTPTQRKDLLKMSDGSRPFVEKVMDYVDSEPQFLPPYLPVEELKKDWGAVKGLGPILNSANLFNDNLSDTLMLAGSESFDGALSYYNTVKYAARMNAPGAKGIYEDLKKRFDKNSSEESSQAA